MGKVINYEDVLGKWFFDSTKDRQVIKLQEWFYNDPTNKECLDVYEELGIDGEE
jgi:hypothetical protein